MSIVECRMSSAVIYRSLRKAMCGGGAVVRFTMGNKMAKKALGL